MITVVRKMAWIGSAYFAGLFFASFLTPEMDRILALVGLILATGYYFLVDNKKLSIPVCIITAALAMTVYSLYEERVYEPILQYDGQEAVLEGTLLEMRYYSADKTGYIIQGEVDGHKGYYALYCDLIDADYYDRITVKGTLHRFKDTYTFPAESYNKAQSVFLEMTEPTEINVRKVFSLRRILLQYRDYLYEVIHRFLPEQEGEMMAAMLCGDKTGLDSDVKTLMYRSGIGHVMSVSGMHLTIVTGFVYELLKAFRLNKKARIFFMGILVLAFTVFAGLTETVMRSAIMVTIVYGADLFKRKADTFNSLGISLLFFLIPEPFLVRNASLMLSAVGVFGIGVIAPAFTSRIHIQGIKGWFLRQLGAMVCVMLIIFPASMLFFDEISILSPITNVLLLPFCTAALIAGVIVALTGGVAFIAFPLLTVAGLCCKAVYAVSEFIGRLDWAYIPAGYRYLPVVTVLAVGAVLTGHLLFRKFKKVAFTAVACAAAMAVCLISNRMLRQDVLTVTVLGDSQSSSLILCKGDQASIIDLNGGRILPKANQKYLRQKGIQDIAFLVLNSNTLQSAASYEKRFQLFRVEQVLVPEKVSSLAGIKLLKRQPLYYNPDDTALTLENYTVHIEDNSAVTVKYGDFSIQCLPEQGDNQSETYGLTVFYSSDQPSATGLSLGDGFAGYEIDCLEDGKLKIRRIPYGGRQ